MGAKYREYLVRVRTHGTALIGSSYDDSEGDFAQMVVSNFSDYISFRTTGDVPSAPPTSFSAFLRSSAHFQWGPIPENRSNVIITYYSVTCHYQSNGVLRETIRNVSNSTFTAELQELMRETQYECSMAAGTKVGHGPHSVSVLFTTPADLSLTPAPPRNVAFALISHSDSTRPDIILQARWAVQDCETEFSCLEVIGYLVLCTDDDNNEIRRIVWQYEVAELRGSLASVNLSVRPFTRYQCIMASINGNGVGFYGSRVLVTTDEQAPYLSPSQIYVTDVLPESVRLHWTYSDPEPVAFVIDIYYQNINDPDRIYNNLFVHRERYRISSGAFQQQTEFSYNLMYLLPATSYIIVIAASSREGAGPGTRTVVTTQRTVPTSVPTDLVYTVNSFVKPFRFRFSWQLRQPNSISGQSMIHSGFTITCSTNETVTNFVPPGSDIISHTVFTSTIEDSYSADVYMPTNCDVQIAHYSCSVRAFNEEGVGPRGLAITTLLPCDFNGDPLSGSVLANPYFSVVFLVLTLLLLICVIVSCLAFCLSCKHNKNRIEEEKHYSTVNEIYDESYIPMAPSSDVNFKPAGPTWTRNYSIAQRMVPPIPLSARSSLEGTDMTNDNTYDEIPGGAGGVANHTHQQPNNLYAEIVPHASPAIRSSGRGQSNRARGSTSRPTSASVGANDTVITRHSGSLRTSRETNPLPNHQERQYQLDDSTATTSTAVSRLELSLSTHTSAANAATELPGGDNPFCAASLLHPSASNTTSLSGNDYVEVMSHGETRPLTKRIYNSSNSLSKSAGSLSKSQFSADGGSHVEVKYNPYDNIPEIRTPNGVPPGACVGGECKKGEEEGGAEKWRKSGSSACCNSEFVDFIDNMEDRRESLASCLSNDPPYVAMSDCGHQGAAAALQKDSQKDKDTQ